MQLHLPLATVIPKDAYAYGERTSGETHGVVRTKLQIVDMMLDLAGYFEKRDLRRVSFLDPAVGHGVFLVRALQRFLTSCKEFGHDPRDFSDAFLAFDVDKDHVSISRDAVVSELVSASVPIGDAKALAKRWIVQGDFLLASIPARFDIIVGNPPYIRIEQLNPQLQAEYRNRYTSLFDRADLYVAFIERSLDLLTQDGILSFICADRWTLNRYGAPLREKITSDYHVHHYIDLHEASPFESDVIAYPSIFTIGRNGGNRVRVGKLTSVTTEECSEFKQQLINPHSKVLQGASVSTYESWFTGDEPWVLSSPEHLNTLRSLEQLFEPLEADGTTHVRIGVATGADKLYIVPNTQDIEQDRLVPVVMREDLDNGKVLNAQRCVINTFDDDGSLVDLKSYPKLSKYLWGNAVDIKKRHVAQKSPNGWYRTIDRVYPNLVGVPKLLIPDIAGSNEVVLERGKYYPHHNLYFILSSSWDLKVLGGLLSSRVALFFVWSYAVKMRGGYLRFQAQYLRRIRVPRPQSISKKLALDIARAFGDRDFPRLDKLALNAYGLKALPNFEFVDTRK